MSKAPTKANLLRRYPLALACGGLALVLAAVYFLRSGTLGEERTKLEQLETDGKKIERNVRNSAALEEHLAALKAGVAGLEEKLTRLDDVSGNQEYFYGLESASGVRMSVLRPLGAPKTAAAGQNYQPAGFSVVVEGEYAQLIAFLHALETGSRLYRLVDFSVQRASAGVVVEDAAGSAQKEALTINLQLLAAK